MRFLIALSILACCFSTVNAKESEWAEGSPSSLNPSCNNGEIQLTAASAAYYMQPDSASDLRTAFCVNPMKPTSAPAYTGNHLVAYTWLSNQLYPGSEGNIRGLYSAVNIDWGTLRWPKYNKEDCQCGDEGTFNDVNDEIEKEIQAVANIKALFDAISTYYINPLFIEKSNVANTVIANVNLPPVTSVGVSTGAVLENTIFKTVEEAFTVGVAEISPWAPVAISALFNLSRSENDGTVPDQIQAEVESLEAALVDTFKNTITSVSNLRDNIMADYGVYMHLGRYEAAIMEGQLTALVITASTAYERQLYANLIPYAARIVFYDPTDTHLGGGGHAYADANAVTYSKPNSAANTINYLHYAGYLWSKKYYFNTTQQLLTSYAEFDDGDAGSGRLCANAELSSTMYDAIFTKLGFTYDELLALPGLGTFQQCSLCDDDDCRPHNDQCRANSGC